LGRQAALDQRLADRTGTLEHLRVANAAPVAAALAPRRQRALGRNARPLLEPIGQPIREGLERRGRAQQFDSARHPSVFSLQAGADTGVAIAGHVLRTLRALPSRKARMRSLAAGSACAIAAISDSTNRPSDCDMSAMRGSACITAKLDIAAFSAIRRASAIAFAMPSPSRTRYCDSPTCWPSSASST